MASFRGFDELYGLRPYILDIGSSFYLLKLLKRPEFNESSFSPSQPEAQVPPDPEVHFPQAHHFLLPPTDPSSGIVV
jgi:hypothetical protein